MQHFTEDYERAETIKSLVWALRDLIDAVNNKYGNVMGYNFMMEIEDAKTIVKDIVNNIHTISKKIDEDKAQ
jgi:hypothetical protein